MAKKQKKKQNDKDQVAVAMGARLKAERDAHGMSQAELAKRITDAGFPIVYQALGNYERGIRRIPHEVAYALEKIFGKMAGYYLLVLTDEEQQVLATMRKVGPKR